METVVATGSREVRRRRIADRGSERLALITGRIQSLSPDLDLSPSAIRSTDQTPTSFDSSQPEDPSVLNHASVRELGQHDNCVPEAEPLLHNGDKGKSVPSTSMTSLSEGPVFQVPPSVQSSAKACQHEHRNAFTTGEIISAISASENIRTRCAVAAALSVILSYIGFPILDWGVVRGTILFRPLYLLILTNMSIVLARLLSGKHGANAREGQINRVTTSSENGLVDRLGSALESGLLLQNIFGALLMDFSIYVVVLICGLSLMSGS